VIKAVVFDYDWVLTRYYFWPQRKMFNLAKSLQAQGLKTAVLSNRIFPLTWLAGLNDGFKDFDVIVFARQVGAPKPDPESYQAVIKKLELKPQDCLFVDNRDDNIAAAEELGMQVIWAKDTTQVIDNIKRLVKAGKTT
jgi:putative hydrolase of the HAD superfamily